MTTNPPAKKKRKGVFAGVFLFVVLIIGLLATYFGANFLSPLAHIDFLTLFLVLFGVVVSLILFMLGLGPAPLILAILAIGVKIKFFGGF